MSTYQLVDWINPVIRGWGNYYRKAHVRKLFNRLQRWIINRIWSHRFKRWRNDAVGFMELYHPKVPTAVGKLDYYGRQVLLTAEHGDWQQASKAAKAAEEVWNTIKGKVEKINVAHAKTFSDTLMKMSVAVKKRNVALTKQLSKKLLDDVDTLEAEFNK